MFSGAAASISFCTETISTASDAAVQSPTHTGIFQAICNFVTPSSIALYSGALLLSVRITTASTSVYSAKNCVIIVALYTRGAWRTKIFCSAHPKALNDSTVAGRLR